MVEGVGGVEICKQIFFYLLHPPTFERFTVSANEMRYANRTRWHVYFMKHHRVYVCIYMWVCASVYSIHTIIPKQRSQPGK